MSKVPLLPCKDHHITPAMKVSDDDIQITMTSKSGAWLLGDERTAFVDVSGLTLSLIFPPECDRNELTASSKNFSPYFFIFHYAYQNLFIVARNSYRPIGRSDCEFNNIANPNRKRDETIGHCNATALIVYMLHREFNRSF